MRPPSFDEFPRIIGRRRALIVLAAGLGTALPGLGASAVAKSRVPTLEWEGRALGAPARIVIRHPDEFRVRRLLRHCVREIERLDGIFSLYRRDSELSRLNDDGCLDGASLDLRLVLAESQRLGVLSGGTFDVTIQPLWRLYERHFATLPRSHTGPDRRQIERAAGLVDYRGIAIDGGGIRLSRDGMAVSLNGIVQGYLTDRITDMLRDAGLSNLLVDLGEIRAVGNDGARPWRVGIETPAGLQSVRGLDLPEDAALATSAGYGTRFEPSGRFHHLFDPATGTCPGQVVSATAVASTAMRADALATTLAVAPVERARSLVRAFRASAARLSLADGRELEESS